MTSPAPLFPAYSVEDPDIDELLAGYDAVVGSLDRATSTSERLSALDERETLERRYRNWSSLARVRYTQDTRDEARQRRRELADGLDARIAERETAIKGQVLSAPDRPALESSIGAQVLAMWDKDRATFDAVISDDIVEESRLSAAYTSLLAGARIPFEGRELNLAGVVKNLSSPDRARREAAERARWGWFASQRPELDRIFGELVTLRHGMARKLGFDDFVEMGYARMHRVDYDRADVERFRSAVRERVVPLAAELRRQQAERLGVDVLRSWDETIQDPAGNPTPTDDPDALVEQARGMFHSVHPDIGAFFDMLVDRQLLDVTTRDGKAAGGYCSWLAGLEVPFVFANFNGTMDDVRVLTHEIGHAFQGWQSRTLPRLDQMHPTYDACEIHSMALEFLCWPGMDRFFGDDAARYRRLHLQEALLFLPYGVAVDHFQHLVYENPDASPAERCAMWQQMEAAYLPWRNHADLPHASEGGFWQRQLHIYVHPFYYIDYVLAQTCALQYWDWAERDRNAALESYRALCTRGGTQPFQALCRSADLVPPFEEGCLDRVVGRAREWLGV